MKLTVCKRTSLKLVLGAAVLGLVVVCAAGPTQAQTLTTLHNFTYGADGGTPFSGLVADKQGNLYGLASWGGIQNCSEPGWGTGCGSVYELTPSEGGWTFNVLYSFAGSPDASNPDVVSLIFDRRGNLYGTTQLGGTETTGTVFELSPSEGGWTEKVLHSFCSASGCADGEEPFSGVILDKKGNLYGATSYGGAQSGGTVFKLTPSKSGWTETVLYNFCSEGGDSCTDGFWPADMSLIFDKQGNLYGTTGLGGAYGYGTVFEITPKGVETVLHSFTGGTDGGFPTAGLIFDKSGNLYSTTWIGGDLSACNNAPYYGCGVVFELTPPSGGSGAWTETVLHSFDSSDGAYPYAGVIFDKKGNLYGETSGRNVFGGTAGSGYGTVFELTPSGGSWTETVLHSFDGADGAWPTGGLILGKKGILYGTAALGGAYGYGTVFALNPKK